MSVIQQGNCYYAIHGRGRHDGYDAMARPVRRTDNAPYGARWLVRYTSVEDGHTRVRFFSDREEAIRAVAYGSAYSADPE